MERGFDQLIFFAFIVLAALVDWVMRVIRNRNAPPRPRVEEPEVEYVEDEAAYPEEDVTARWHEAPRVESPQQEPLRTAGPPPERVFDAPVPVEWRRVIEAARAVPDASRLPVHVAPSAQREHAVAARPRTGGPAASQRAATQGSRWRSEVLWLKEPNAARRAIVMMAVLGPCRALEDQPRRS